MFSVLSRFQCVLFIAVKKLSYQRNSDIEDAREVYRNISITIVIYKIIFAFLYTKIG